MGIKKKITFLSKIDLTFLLIAIVSVIFIYKRILNGYFQQDEWYGFGYIISNRHLPVWELFKLYFAPNIGHYNPLTNITQHYLYLLWGTNYVNYAYLSIFLHILIVVGVFVLSKIIFSGNSFKAFLCCLLFGLFASTYQGTAWVVVSIATQVATILGVISSILFLSFLKRGQLNLLILSLVVLAISLLFKEITIGLLPLYIGLYLISKNNLKKIFNKPALIIMSFGICYVLFRAMMLYAPNTSRSSLVTQTQSPANIFYNFSTISIKSIFQALLPASYTKQLSLGLAKGLPDEITGLPGSPEFEKFSVEKLMEFMNIFFGSVLLIIGIITVHMSKNRDFKFISIIGFGWIILNSLIYSFAPESSGPIYAIDSRNLYFVAIGAAILIVNYMPLNIRERRGVMGLLIIFLYLGFNALSLNNTLDSFTRVGATRKMILNNIGMRYPTIPPKATFYIKSDTIYYGLPESETTLPFQSGFGQTLLISYSQNEEFPHEFYPGDYLWGLKSQGYEEHNSRGFGYFRDESLLKDALKKYRLPVSSVIAFEWKGKTNELIDVTKKTQNEINK